MTQATALCVQVGDNPTSDMEGVRRANIHHHGSTTLWQGVLVRTGVYKEGDETNGAHVVVEGIEQAGLSTRGAWVGRVGGVGREHPLPCSTAHPRTHSLHTRLLLYVRTYLRTDSSRR